MTGISCDFLSSLCQTHLFRLHCTIRLSLVSVGILTFQTLQSNDEKVFGSHLVFKSCKVYEDRQQGSECKTPFLPSKYVLFSPVCRIQVLFFSSGLITLEFFYTQ